MSPSGSSMHSELHMCTGLWLQDLEERWASLQSQIEALRAEKKEIVATVVEAEKDVLVMERRIQLEREMQVGGWCRWGVGHVGCGELGEWAGWGN